MSQRWLIAFLGLWLIVSPWLLGFAGVNLAVISNIAVGLLLWLALLQDAYK